ncbi:MAG: TraB/GumN family protein [Halobacteria archaeon]
MDEDGEIDLVGTAHVSEKSVEEVEESIETEQPDIVAVELDENRYKSIKGEGERDDIEAGDLIKGKKPFELLVYWLLSYLQTQLGDQFDIEPGADMMAAIDSAEERGIPVALVDRDIQVTVARLWANMGILEKIKFVGSMILGIAGFGGSGEDIDVDELTEGDMVEVMIEEFRKISPGATEALIDERDAYIAANLLALKKRGYHVVAVVGAGHVEGIERYLASPNTIPDIESLEGKKEGGFSVFKVLGYLVTLFIIFLFVLLIMAGASSAFLGKLFFGWFLINGIFAFTGALIAGSHLTSATVGGVLAWMTSINPLLAPGWFSGYVELRYIEVSVKDIDRINEILADTESSARNLLGRMYDVPMFRLLIIVALTNLGSIIGTVLFITVILPWIGADVDMTHLLKKGLHNSLDAIIQGIQNLVGLS